MGTLKLTAIIYIVWNSHPKPFLLERQRGDRQAHYTIHVVEKEN